MRAALLILGVALVAAWTLTVLMGGGVTECSPTVMGDCR